MKVSVKKLDPLRRELNFEVPQNRVAKALDEIFDELCRVSKIKGFRPGKAPRHLVEQQHGPLAREEALKKLIPAVYREGIEQESLSPLDLPEISDVQFNSAGVSFKAVIDIKPEVKLGEYKGIPVKRKSAEVTDEEITKTLEYFRQSQGQDEKTPIDDEFAKGLGYPNLEEFKESLSRQMAMDKDRQTKLDVENQIIERLLKDAKLAVPQSLVKKQLEHRVHEARHRLEHQGLPEEEINKKEKDLRRELKEPVEKDVKVYLIFDRIAELEKITVKEGESLPRKVMEYLLKVASWEK